MKNKFIFLSGLILFASVVLGCNFNSSNAVASITVKTEPAKTVYTVGEKFDPTGLVITATLDNNTTQDITYSEDSGITLDVPKMNTSGEKEITVTYQEQTTTFKITVNPKVRSIAVKTNPNKTAYLIDETFDPSGLVITVTYSNETTEDIEYSTDSGITFSEVDMSAAGSKTVTVTYKEQTATFKVTVKAATLTSISIKTNPDKTAYTVKETFDPTGLVITVTYSDSTTTDVSYSETSGITLSALDMTTAGDKTVTVTYKEKTATFTVSVKAATVTVTSIAVKTNPTTTSYTVKGTFNPSGLVITVTYSDSTTADITYSASSGITLSSPDMTTTGTKTVTVTYKEKKTTFSISVTAATLTSISIKTNPSKLYYDCDSEKTEQAVDLTGLVLTRTYSNSTTDTLTYSSTAGITASTIDCSTTGTKTVTVTYSGKTAEFEVTVADYSSWTNSSVPSLYETYKDQFDYIGIAAEYGNFGLSSSGSNKYTATYTASGSWGTPSELYYEEIQNGIAKHANSITLGNELKPQFVLAWWSAGSGKSQTMTSFTASNGKTIDVPNSLNNEKLIYATLNVAKKMGVQMRGHVLTWHSQTPDDFFAEGYSAEYTDSTQATLSNPVDEETMTARHEWYIKSVLECVANWEEANGYGTGNHLIWAWDVVNEATADNAGKTYTGDSQDWLRGSTSGTKDVAPGSGGSRWYQIYGDDEFIVNAFRFANAYAPSDVKLCYNDYNEYWDASGHYKTSAICHLVEDVQSGAAKTVNGASVSPRIDVVAMQSHVGTAWPGVSSYESALQRFLALGCDVHVSELDFSATTREAAVTAYGDYFTMLQKYGKNYSGTNKVTSITIWGINDENSWINPSSSGGSKTYPLLFNIVDNVTTSTKTVTYNTGDETLPLYDVGDTYAPNDSFNAVISAHEASN